MADERQPGELSGRHTPYRLEATPTVVTGKAIVAYALPKAGSIEFALFDATGRLATVLARGESQSGEYTTSLPAASTCSDIAQASTRHPASSSFSNGSVRRERGGLAPPPLFELDSPRPAR
jgi:hypothetical protein